ncbi:MAG: hypothetical protein D6762_06760 [Candidatus Neomarinimicrobiota bacterium]|nr:MAG: hypothetical protein D6762_06760 [Candidatus Neomarinimicrobiota bacterium]
MKTISSKLVFSLSILVFFTSCSQRPKSAVDTPEYHFKAGMRAYENGNFDQALKSFQRSVDLSKKFALGYGGLGLVYAAQNNLRDAKINIGLCEQKANGDPDAYALAARCWIRLRDQEVRWFQLATHDLDRALNKDPAHEASLYYYGVANLYSYEFATAEDYFRQVVDMKGDYAKKADEKWQMSQKIVRAMPGTDVGKKVALQDQITRADLAVLFMEELKVAELFERQPTAAPEFMTPTQMQAMKQTVSPVDVGGHWAEVWINDAIKYGVMDVYPDGLFYPDETVTRAGYAMAVQRLLVAATGDHSLETRYIGESPSRFSDVQSTVPAYNAMALCAERGIMQADVVTGRFNPTGVVSGADALLIIRTLQNSLRMTF